LFLNYQGRRVEYEESEGLFSKKASADRFLSWLTPAERIWAEGSRSGGLDQIVTAF
jgi:hypothetical protein